MPNTFSLIISAAMLLAFLIDVTNTASIGSSSPLEKLTCRHQDVAKKRMWKKCKNTNLVPPYKGAPLDLPFKLSHNLLPVMDIPPK